MLVALGEVYQRLTRPIDAEKSFIQAYRVSLNLNFGAKPKISKI